MPASYPSAIKSWTDKVDNVDDVVAADINTAYAEITAVETQLLADMTDYSASSTIVGWTSFTTKSIYYKKIGKLVFVYVRLVGTSNSTSTTFTLPYALTGPISNAMATGRDNNVDTFISFSLPASGSTATVYVNQATAWTASGTKIVSGQFFYVTS